MTRDRLLAWLMLAAWASWLTAAQGLIVARTPLGPWTPDLGILLAVACAGALHRRDMPLATLLVALGRIAHSVEPPVAVLAGFLAAALTVQSARRVTEVGGVFLRASLGGGLALGFALWLALVHALRVGGDATGALATALPQALATALVTALFALVFSPSLVHLPGLTPLRERKW